jgi:predicted membrane channel-forming protein YqfA (hemolysin III family)
MFGKDSVRVVASYADPLSRHFTARLLFHFAAALCFLCSTLYHTFSNSPSAHHWRHIDHLGIQLSIWATAYSFVAVAFQRNRARQLTYFVCITSGFLTFATFLWTMWYHETGTQRSRTTIHVIFGAACTLPALEYWYSRDPDAVILRGFFSLVAINSIGGWVFEADLLALLERRSGLPDLSHAFMHIMAVFGARIYGRSLEPARD